MLGLGPFAGVIVDRVDIKRLMLAVSLFLMILSAGMGLLLEFDLMEVWHLFLFMRPDFLHRGGISQAVF